MCNLQIPALLLYSYVPAIIISLFLGWFIYVSDKKSETNRNLMIFIFFFTFWAIISMLGWLIPTLNVNLLLARISVLEVVSMAFFIFFIMSLANETILTKTKFLYLLPYVPIIALIFTDYNSYISNFENCETQNGVLYWYVYLIAFIYALIAVKKLFFLYKKEINNIQVKNQIKIIGSGLVLVVLWFGFFTEFANISMANGYFWRDEIFLFTPFGMLIFFAMLVYAITKYRFLHMKLLAAQVLTYSIWILVGSQFFFANSLTVYLLISLTLILSVLFGIMLVKSIKQEVERKEELQLMADKLASANDQLRKLDNAKTEFISIASHQLRTPITAIKGFASLLLEGSYGELGEGVHGAVEKIYASSERLVALIEDLLNVSRIESGRMQFAFEKSSVEKLIKELYDNFALVAKTKGFFLEVELPEKQLPEVMMDYTKIRELVSNFMDNALKYTEKGGATIMAELKENGVVIDENGFVIPNRKAEYGEVVRITVKDTGIGIPKEEIPYLFKKFSRGKDVSRLHVGGTGLGLYVGKAIAEAHHGQVWVESEGDGKGSSFIIEIPVNKTDEPGYHVKDLIESL